MLFAIYTLPEHVGSKHTAKLIQGIAIERKGKPLTSIFEISVYFAIWVGVEKLLRSFDIEFRHLWIFLKVLHAFFL